MDQLINEISSRTGISQDQARQAVDMVFSHIKQYVPEPFASQIQGMMGTTNATGGTAAAGSTNQDMTNSAEQMLGDLGGMFGGKK